MKHSQPRLISIFLKAACCFCLLLFSGCGHFNKKERGLVAVASAYVNGYRLTMRFHDESYFEFWMDKTVLRVFHGEYKISGDTLHLAFANSEAPALTGNTFFIAREGLVCLNTKLIMRYVISNDKFLFKDAYQLNPYFKTTLNGDQLQGEWLYCNEDRKALSINKNRLIRYYDRTRKADTFSIRLLHESPKQFKEGLKGLFIMQTGEKHKDRRDTNVLQVLQLNDSVLFMAFYGNDGCIPIHIKYGVFNRAR